MSWQRQISGVNLPALSGHSATYVENSVVVFGGNATNPRNPSIPDSMVSGLYMLDLGV
jgi:hypothetical protein